ncbi:pre-mRNA splicing Prp18-interacting factor [Actinidia rufa]|uniref:Pre-mRNA-splicing factor SLU7 n=1 Tax=Actinidia rufa TaxID=165716 RepID=A0A7J0G0J2_9ERIC|nr:pre-mRNA splicing Prp18-interacting factor [Actinidia rufa]
MQGLWIFLGCGLSIHRYDGMANCQLIVSIMHLHIELTWSTLCHMQETALPRSKYEDVYINSHTSVWGSWWIDHRWGYKCCKQTIRNSYSIGVAGIEAAEAAADLMKANIARKGNAEGLCALY